MSCKPVLGDIIYVDTFPGGWGLCQDDANLAAQGPHFENHHFNRNLPPEWHFPNLPCPQDCHWRETPRLRICHDVTCFTDFPYSDIIAENISPHWEVWCRSKLQQEAQHRWEQGEKRGEALCPFEGPWFDWGVYMSLSAAHRSSSPPLNREQPSPPQWCSGPGPQVLFRWSAGRLKFMD